MVLETKHFAFYPILCIFLIYDGILLCFQFQPHIFDVFGIQQMKVSQILYVMRMIS